MGVLHLPPSMTTHAAEFACFGAIQILLCSFTYSPSMKTHAAKFACFGAIRILPLLAFAWPYSRTPVGFHLGPLAVGPHCHNYVSCSPSMTCAATISLFACFRALCIPSLLAFTSLCLAL